MKLFFKNESSIESAKQTSRLTSFLFMLIHIFYCTFFFITDVKILGFYNIGSIIFYFIFIFLSVKNVKVYTLLSFYEILAYCLTATICVGWDFGFQMLFTGMVTIIFYAGYMAKKLEDYNFHPVIMSLQSLALYLFTAVWCYFKEPIYKNIPFAHFMNVMHGVTVFSFLLLFGYILTEYSLALEDKIYKESITDPLTKINNRNGMISKYELISKEELQNYIVAIYDIDDFKKLNDKYGHVSGDVVLRLIARTISAAYPDDIVCRWGGEEFVTILKIEESKEEIYNKIDSLRESISNHTFKLKGKNVNVTITIGAKDFQNFESLEKWVSAADKNLYKGKEQGKNRLIY